VNDLDAIARAAAADGLAVVGAFHPGAEDLPPEGCATLVLLGPGGPEMWEAFTASAECSDGEPHPMDRWSTRVIGALAERFGAAALFPFGGPPYQPFQRWAVRAEGARTSPVAMQVTPERGLWASYRGALAFGTRLDLPLAAHTDPCAGCAAPCLTACPVGAFTDGTYDVPKCTGHVQGVDGAGCREGCLVRRACPAGAGMDLPAAQRAFHLDAFLRANG
jgi:hypothetical protein